MKQAQQVTVEKMQGRDNSQKEVMERIAKLEKALEKFSHPTRNNLLTDFGQAMSYRFNDNVHQAAAMVIARRGMGLSDRSMPKYVMCVVSNSLQYFWLPENNLKMTIWEYFKIIRKTYDAWFTDKYEMLRAKRKSPPQCVPLEDINF